MRADTYATRSPELTRSAVVSAASTAHDEGSPRSTPPAPAGSLGQPLPSPALARQELQARVGPRGQGRRDVRRHRHVRALEAAERAERSELDVLEQLRPEQRRADAVVEPDVGPPPEVRGVGWLNGVLIRLGYDRRDVVDARV